MLRAYRYDESMREITGKTDKSIDFILNSRYDKKNTDAGRQAHDVTELYSHLEVTVPYLAEYQVTNSSLAMAAVRVIDPQKTISDEQVAKRHCGNEMAGAYGDSDARRGIGRRA